MWIRGGMSGAHENMFELTESWKTTRAMHLLSANSGECWRPPVHSLRVDRSARIHLNFGCFHALAFGSRCNGLCRRTAFARLRPVRIELVARACNALAVLRNGISSNEQNIVLNRSDCASDSPSRSRSGSGRQRCAHKRAVKAKGAMSCGKCSEQWFLAALSAFQHSG